jgi:hypothetical protein
MRKEKRKGEKGNREREEAGVLVPARFAAVTAAVRPPRLFGHARATLARCARRTREIASAPIAAVGHAWATGHRAVRNGMVRVGCQGGGEKRRGLGLGFARASMTIRFLIETLQHVV